MATSSATGATLLNIREVYSIEGEGLRNLAGTGTVARREPVRDPRSSGYGVALSSASEERGNVVMVRLSDDALVSSRSEGAAVLIGAGIESQKELFDRLAAYTDEIRKLKEQLRQVALEALKPTKR